MGVEIVGGDHAEGFVVFAGGDAAAAGAVGADDDGSFGFGEGVLFDVGDQAGTGSGHDDALDSAGQEGLDENGIGLDVGVEDFDGRKLLKGGDVEFRGGGVASGGGAVEADFIAVDKAEVAEVGGAEGFDAKGVRFSDVSGGADFVVQDD